MINDEREHQAKQLTYQSDLLEAMAYGAAGRSFTISQAMFAGAEALRDKAHAINVAIIRDHSKRAPKRTKRSKAKR